MKTELNLKHKRVVVDEQKQNKTVWDGIKQETAP